jgi:putative heme iron utilization protein
MTVDQTAGEIAADQAGDARQLMRTAVKASLATLDHETGHPYVSLVLLATEPDASPIFLLSKLARHVKNLKQDARASVLFDGTGDLDEPLSGDRLTVWGEVRPTTSGTARRRFLARHASAEGYVGFPDFSFYALDATAAHFIGGFGRIFGVERSALLTDTTGAQGLIEAESDIVAHMNSDHADAVGLYASVLAGKPEADWRMCGIDPAGIDLLHRTTAARINFPCVVRTPGEARKALIELVQQARAKQVAETR